MGMFSRAASLAAVPVKTGARFAGAATASAFGADKDTAYGNALASSVESLTTALAKARGPALKFGQILALFSSTLPPEQAAQMASLGRLYENAHPRPWAKVEPLVVGLPPGAHIDPRRSRRPASGRSTPARGPTERRSPSRSSTPTRIASSGRTCSSCARSSRSSTGSCRPWT